MNFETNLNKIISNTHTFVFVNVGTFHRLLLFILYKPYYLSPYNQPTPKPNPLQEHFCIFTFSKNSFCMINKPFEYGDNENVLINHLLLVIPTSYPCHYTIGVSYVTKNKHT